MLIENPIITFDVDWAPDFILQKVFHILEDSNVKSTWFVTHDSPIIRRLQKNSLFEVGLHPNFAPSSTQGDSSEEILRNLKKIVPKAKSIRTHDLLQSSSILSKFQKFGIENDVSLLLEFTSNLNPHFSKYFNLFRFPFFWEDDVFMSNKSKWAIDEPKFNPKGMKIFNFHPIHIFLNSKNMNNYNLMKKKIGLENLNEKNIIDFIEKTNTAELNFFTTLIKNLSDSISYTITDLQEKFVEEHDELRN